MVNQIIEAYEKGVAVGKGLILCELDEAYCDGHAKGFAKGQKSAPTIPDGKSGTISKLQAIKSLKASADYRCHSVAELNDIVMNIGKLLNLEII